MRARFLPVTPGVDARFQSDSAESADIARTRDLHAAGLTGRRRDRNRRIYRKAGPTPAHSGRSPLAIRNTYVPPLCRGGI